jgi:hypothetical protein
MLPRTNFRPPGITAVASAVIVVASCGFLPISTFSRSGTDVLERAPKPPPVDSSFVGCGPAGSQPDYVLNRKKNRIDSATTYLALPWKTIAQLPWPRGTGFRFRNQWSRGERDAVARYEGVAVQVEGYLAGHRLEVPEPPNCYSNEPRHKDYHMWLSESPHRKKRQSIVVEITPRVRATHPEWTEARLAALQRAQSRIRVSGWLMLDEMHPEKIEGNRITLWEVHPIMRLEWQRSDSSWAGLESLSP